MDCFGGKEDLKNRILKCVGEPERRFREDALRILRCLRFSSALEFAIEEDTRQALLKHRELLKKIAPERLQAGIFQADPGRVGGAGADRVSPGFPGVFAGGGPAPECLELAAGGKKSSGWPASFPAVLPMRPRGRWKGCGMMEKPSEQSRR